MSELPKAGELLAREPPFLPQNNGETKSNKDYLEIQYRQYRFEGAELLRRVVSSYRDNDESYAHETFVYTQVCT